MNYVSINGVIIDDEQWGTLESEDKLFEFYETVVTKKGDAEDSFTMLAYTKPG